MNAPLLQRARLCVLLALSLATPLAALAQFIPPTVANVTATQPTAGSLPSPNVNISFTISDVNANSTIDNIGIIVSSDGGNTWTVPASSFTPGTSPSWSWSTAAGYGTVPASSTPANYSLTWNALADWPGQFTSACKVRVFAWNNGMALIPSGSYVRGNSVTGTDPAGYAVNGADPDITDAPTNSVYVTAFLMDSNLVTKSLWSLVSGYGSNNAYTFENSGSAQGANFPVWGVNWYDAVKWCNARSQLEGIMPVYYTDAGFQNIYTSGPDTDTVYIKPGANGYRLPTEAEWEKAARGAQIGDRFPGSDVISDQSQADYASDGTYAGTSQGQCGPGLYSLNFARPVYPYDEGPFAPGPACYPATQTTLPTYNNFAATSPVGLFAPNGYGVYDMAGNLNEWCWDWYGATYFKAGQLNPQGPGSGTGRVTRGGSWYDFASILRCANRGNAAPNSAPTSSPFQIFGPTPSGPGPFGTIGFRCVRGF